MRYFKISDGALVAPFLFWFCSSFVHADSRKYLSLRRAEQAPSSFGHALGPGFHCHKGTNMVHRQTSKADRHPRAHNGKLLTSRLDLYRRELLAALSDVPF